MTPNLNRYALNWSKRGLSAASITRESPKAVQDGVMRGNYKLVFFTPELLITKEKWRAMLSGPVYGARIVAFIVDKAHCVKKW